MGQGNGMPSARAERAAQRYLQRYRARQEEFEAAAGAFGLPFESDESSPRAKRAALSASCSCENGDASIWRSWISPACLACRKGQRMETFFVSLQCNKDCFFCFNPNQEDHDRFVREKRDIALELREAHGQGAVFEYLAVTGGEPLLHPDEVVAFLETARELYPGAHLRLYTNGDLADGEMLGRLARAGLDEIRFSIKPFDVDDDRERILVTIGEAVAVIPDVVVEMPVIPGSLEEMRDLLVRLDELGVRGINLLEFCFPMHNAEAFAERGFSLRKNPYAVLYNYWYAGGLPVAGSERECLALLSFASERGLSLGVHYCSLDNKNTSQIFRQSSLFKRWNGRRRYGWLTFDEHDYFLKCVRGFGVDKAQVQKWAERVREAGLEGEAWWSYDGSTDSFLVPVRLADEVSSAFPQAVLMTSYNVFEQAPGVEGAPSWKVTEVHVEPWVAARRPAVA